MMNVNEGLVCSVFPSLFAYIQVGASAQVCRLSKGDENMFAATRKLGKFETFRISL